MLEKAVNKHGEEGWVDKDWGVFGKEALMHAPVRASGCECTKDMEQAAQKGIIHRVVQGL